MKAPVAISQCLVGDPVRYNGKDKYDDELLSSLGSRLLLHPICPEVAIGLGVPRNPIQLVQVDNNVRVREVNDTTVDLTSRMQAQATADSARLVNVSGYIVMQGSPSCGLHDVKRFDETGLLLDEAGQGIYIAAVKQLLPLLPVEAANILHNKPHLDNFLTRVFTLYDWQQSTQGSPSAKQLVAFHSRYKYLLMAHNAHAYRVLGKMLSNLSGDDLLRLANEYIGALLVALQKPVNRGGQTNVLLHLKGYFREVLGQQEHKEFDALAVSYQAGNIPLSKPRRYLHERVERTGDCYLALQTWWQPYPDADVLQDGL
jgi:uncharacterized protein YbgA (DUF1722 family)/uncharacterized protein YbbK (DUF523 family)